MTVEVLPNTGLSNRGVERSTDQVLKMFGDRPLSERIRALSALSPDDLRVLFRPRTFPLGSVESVR